MDVNGEIHFAPVAEVKNPGTVHVVVYPDENGDPVEEQLPPPRLLVLVEEGSDQWALYCYDGEGEFAGDTAHESFEEAIEHAKFAYGDAVGEWQRVQVSNIDAFVRETLAR